MHDKIKYSTCHVTPGRPAALGPCRVELRALVRDSCVGERSGEAISKDQVSTKILSAFTEAVKVTVFQKIGHNLSCLPHGIKKKF
jgi:hypothetical protein